MDPTPQTLPSDAVPRAARGWVWAAASVPAVLAVLQLGRLHPDEVYQLLEPAYFRAHGYGILAWEWHEGLRNWAIPGLFGWLLSLTRLAGIDHPRLYRAVLEVPQYLLHVWALFAAYRFIQRRVAGPGTLPAFLALGLYGPWVMFAGRTMSESFSTAFLLVAAEALDRDEERPRHGLLGGVALGLAFVARYASAVMVVAALLWLVLRRRWRLLGWAVAGGALIAAGLGLLDWVTWGSPFHSAVKYVQYNVLTGQAAARFGAEPWTYYLPRLFGLFPAWAYLALPFAVMKPGRRLQLPLFMALVYVAVLTATAHKELRFLYPALVLLTLTAAPGLARLVELLHRPRLRQAALLLALLTGLLPGFFVGLERDDQFRAIVRATRPAEATGLLIVGDGLWGSGGYFYIGKRIPWTVADWPHEGNFRGAMADPRFNRVVTYDDRAREALLGAGFRDVERIGRASILAR